MQKLIINADDFGWSEERDRGILELLEGGYLGSVSAMANGSNFGMGKNFSVGLHVNLTEGPAVVPGSSLGEPGEYQENEMGKS